MLKAIYIFYVMQFSPQFIDARSPAFWRNSVRFLNKLREGRDGFLLAKWWRIGVRDPYSLPGNPQAWRFSRKHPFCWQR